MLEWAVRECRGPVAIRYPRGGDGKIVRAVEKTPVRTGTDLTIVCYGTMINQVEEAAELLSSQGISPEVLRLRSIKPLDWETVSTSVRKTGRLLVVEEAPAAGSVGHTLISCLSQAGIRATFATQNTGENFVTHGSVGELYHMLKLDAEAIAAKAREVVRCED